MSDFLLKVLEIDENEVRCCLECGTKEVRVAAERHSFAYTHGSAVELIVMMPIWTCGACDFAYTDGRGEAIEEEAINRYLQRRLTSQEIRSIRKKYSWSRAQFARVTGYSEKSIKRWETDKLLQSASADRFIRLLDSDVAVWQLLLLDKKIDAAKK